MLFIRITPPLRRTLSHESVRRAQQEAAGGGREGPRHGAGGSGGHGTAAGGAGGGEGGRNQGAQLLILLGVYIFTFHSVDFALHVLLLD